MYLYSLVGRFGDNNMQGIEQRGEKQQGRTGGKKSGMDYDARVRGEGGGDEGHIPGGEGWRIEW